MRARTRAAALGAVGAVSVATLLLSADGSSRRAASPKPGAHARTPERPAARLSSAPAPVTRACARAAAHAAFPVLCPARWPSPAGAAAARARLFEKAPGAYLVDAENGFSRRGGHVFHLLIGGQRREFARWPAAVDPRLRVTTRLEERALRGGGTYVVERPARPIGTARVHGSAATVLREPPYPLGGLQGGHVVVLWNEGGHGYLVSVHGERLAEPALVSVALAIARSAAD